jgi:hypothetical protein
MKYLILIILINSYLFSQSAYLLKDSTRITGILTSEDSNVQLVLDHEGRTKKIVKNDILSTIKRKSFIKFKNRSKQVSHIYKITQDSIFIENNDSNQVVDRASVKKFLYKEYKDVEIENLAPEEEYLMLGASVSSFGSINLVFGYQFLSRIGSKVHIGYNGYDQLSYQLNLMGNILKMKYLESNLILAIGAANNFIRNDSYYGILGDINFFGLNLELGAVTFGEYPLVILNVGFVWRFN